MRREENAVIAAKIVNIVCAVLLTLSGVLLLCLPDLQTVTTQRVVFGVLFFLMCAAKVFGYFTNDLYRLAFQFDFAIGVFCGLLALMLVITPERAFHSLPTVITAFVVLDALFKLQMAFDARRFGMKSWIIMLLTALILLLTGGFALGSLLYPLVEERTAVALALLVDGVENLWVTAHTVRIRARKKNLSERFGVG